MAAFVIADGLRWAGGADVTEITVDHPSEAYDGAAIIFCIGWYYLGTADDSLRVTPPASLGESGVNYTQGVTDLDFSDGWVFHQEFIEIPVGADPAADTYTFTLDDEYDQVVACAIAYDPWTDTATAGGMGGSGGGGGPVGFNPTNVVFQTVSGGAGSALLMFGCFMGRDDTGSAPSITPDATNFDAPPGSGQLEVSTGQLTMEVAFGQRTPPASFQYKGSFARGGGAGTILYGGTFGTLRDETSLLEVYVPPPPRSDFGASPPLTSRKVVLAELPHQVTSEMRRRTSGTG